jgi:hypothetical protein
MIIVATRVSPANRAGSLLVRRNLPGTLPARRSRIQLGDYACHEADQRLRNVRKNIHGNRDSGTKLSAGTSGSRKNQPKAVWMRCRNCVSTRKLKQRYSTSTPTNTIRRRNLRRTAEAPIIRVGAFYARVSVYLSKRLTRQGGFARFAKIVEGLTSVACRRRAASWVPSVTGVRGRPS